MLSFTKFFHGLVADDKNRDDVGRPNQVEAMERKTKSNTRSVIGIDSQRKAFMANISSLRKRIFLVCGENLLIHDS